MSTRPNVVIIVADDLGFSDIAPYGSEIPTPNLSRLAQRGIRMSSYYVTPRCSPSRAALMTGYHPHSVGIGVLTTDNGPGGYSGSLSTEVPTIAERMREYGYTTGLFGKWHLSSELDIPCETWPTRRGFDEFRGILQGSSGYFRPALRDGEERVADADLPEDYHLTDDVSQRAAKFIHRAAADEQPFLAVVAYTAPHWPLHARPEEIEVHRDRYRAGWEGLQEQRLSEMQRHGLLTELETFSDEQRQLPTWGEDAAWQSERMAVYAAQVNGMDRGIGEVLAALEASGTAEDTLILFFSDNGGCAEEIAVNAPGFPRPIEPRTTRAGEPVRYGNDPTVMPGPPNTFQSYGAAWATVSNTPFRRWKRWVHEGGISSPCLVSWPAGGIPRGGAVSEALGHVIDVVPTVMGLLGEKEVGEGTDLLEAWRSPAWSGPDRTLFWEHTGNSAVRRGRWKLVREWDEPWELYDMVTDRVESHDVVHEHPALATELLSLYEQWAREHGVIPWQEMLDDHEARGLPAHSALA